MKVLASTAVLSFLDWFGFLLSQAFILYCSINSSFTWCCHNITPDSFEKGNKKVQHFLGFINLETDIDIFEKYDSKKLYFPRRLFTTSFAFRKKLKLLLRIAVCYPTKLISCFMSKAFAVTRYLPTRKAFGLIDKRYPIEIFHLSISKKDSSCAESATRTISIELSDLTRRGDSHQLCIW